MTSFEGMITIESFSSETTNRAVFDLQSNSFLSSCRLTISCLASAETVKVHRRHLYNKLGIKSQSELFLLFLQAQD